MPAPALRDLAATYWPVLLAIVALYAFWVIALVDVSRRQFHRPGDKLLWLMVVAFVQGLGPLVYWVFGRRGGVLTSGGTPHEP